MASPRRQPLVYVSVLTACLGLIVALCIRSSRSGVVVARNTPSPQAQLPKRLDTAPPRVRRIDLSLGSKRQLQQYLAGDVIHRYSFTLKSGQLLHAMVDQDVRRNEAVDVVLQIYGPEGQRLYEIDSPTLASGSEEIFLVANTPGIYRVEINGLESEGTYRIRVLSIHQASGSERLNARAERIFYQARSLTLLQPPKVEEALTGFEAAEKLWQGLGRPQRRAEAFRRCGALLFKQWQVKQALVFQQQALDLYRASGNHDMEAAELIAVGVSRKLLGDLEGAEDRYRRAAQIAKEYGFPERQATALLDLGILLYQRGDSWNAIDACQAAEVLLQRSEQKEKFEELHPFLAIGQIYVSLGKFQTALSQYEKATQILGASRAPGLRAQILSRISELYLNSGDHSRALAYARLALNYREQDGDPRGKAVTLAGMSLILQQRGDLLQARDLQQQALIIFHEIGDLSSEGVAHLNLGHLWLAGGDAKMAAVQFDKAWAIARQQGLKEAEMTALYELAQAERLRGNTVTARKRIEDALSILGSLSVGTSIDELKSLYLSARQKSYGLLVDLLVKSPALYTPPEDIAASFETSERARWQQLADLLTSGRFRSRLLKRADPTLLAERQKVQDEINRVEEVRLRLAQVGRSTTAVQRSQNALVERLQTLDTRINREDSGAAKLNRSTAVSLLDTQQLLDQDSVLLAYELNDTRSFLWLVTPSKAEVFSLPARDVIEAKARTLHQLLSEGQWSANRRQAVPLARELSNILLGPVAGRLGNGGIVVVPDGGINLVPFALLPDPTRMSETWKYGWPAPLILDHRISYSPSASVLRAIRAELAGRPSLPGRLAVLAAPIFTDPNLAPLPLSRQEALAILALIPPSQRTLKAFGDEATRDLAMSGKLGGYQILHFATHATNHPTHPELSSIVLAQVDGRGHPREGHLRLHDIQDLELPVDLIVLSACKTALGSDVRGQGYMGLTQGFLSAGAARVLVSLWNVNEESTPKLMEHFYRALLIERKSPAEALRNAQRWMAEETSWNSPYYWAGFELHGEWR
jgi:CHAT domain-containing protein/tetratricopeptide (TPR) repeat protein